MTTEEELADSLRQRFENSPLGRNLPWDAQSARTKERWIKHARDLLTIISAQGDQGGGSSAIPRGVLAEAMRGLNMKAHPDDGWETVSDSGKKMWLDRARQLQEQIDKSTRRRAS